MREKVDSLQMGFYDDFLSWLDQTISGKYESKNHFAESMGVDPSLITRWVNRERVPKISTITEIFDKLGVKAVILEGNQHASKAEEEIKSVADVARVYKSHGATQEQIIPAILFAAIEPFWRPKTRPWWTSSSLASPLAKTPQGML